MKVSVYGTPACVQCRAVKRKLTAEGVPFEDVDLSRPEAADTLATFKHEYGDPLHLPLVIAYGPDWDTAFQGYDPGQLEDLVLRHRARTI